MRSATLALGTLLLTSGCRAQHHPLADPTADATHVSVNLIIPDPPPTTPAFEDPSTLVPGRIPLTFSVDKVTLRGFFYRNTVPVNQRAAHTDAPTILFFNGNGMTVSAADALYRQIAALGANVIAIDYRGYGLSDGTADLPTFRSDALKIYDHQLVSLPGQRIIVYGYSMGTAIAAYIASQRPVAALILAAPIASAEEEFPVYAHAAGIDIHGLAPSSAAHDVFGESALITRSTAPLLVLHGDADRLVPIAQGREIFAASRSLQKRFVELPSATHNTTATDPEALQAVRQLLQAAR